MLIAGSTFSFLCLCLHFKASVAQDPCENFMNSNDVKLIKECKKESLRKSGVLVADSDISACVGNSIVLDPYAAFQLSQTCKESVGRKKRGVALIFQNPAQKWTNPIFYVFSLNSSISNVEVVKSRIRSTLNYINSQTCLQFIEGQPTLDSQPYIRFLQDANCLTYAGRVLTGSENKIFVNAACWNTMGSLLNLISQSLGLFLEIQRFDRDNFVTVQYTNIPPSRTSDFATYSSNFVTTMGTNYDYSSIMHPPPKWLSGNNQITLLTKSALAQNTIGQRVQYSFQDTQIINNIYCPNSCGVISSPACQNGGYQNPASCGLCKCPDGYGGSDCSAYGQHDPVCSTQFVNVNLGGFGLIQSPGYSSPGFYNKGTTCSWVIKGPAGRRITISFLGEFNIYCDALACNHWVEIRYKRPLYSLGPRMCCNTLPTTALLSDDNEVLVLFRTIDTTPTANFKGFQLRYSIDNEPCAVTFTTNFNTNSPNGWRNLTINNLADCQAFCVALDSCVAIDWDKSSSACWVHQSPSDLANVGQASNVDQYVINRSCPSPVSSTSSSVSSTNPVSASTTTTAASIASTQTTTAASTSTAATPSTTPGGCILWTALRNTNSPGASLANGVTSLDACRGACEQNPSCVAVDFDSNTSPASCWVHTALSNLNAQNAMNNVQQLRISRGCSTTTASTSAQPAVCPSWTTRVNTNSPGGTRLSNAASVAACQSSCIDDTRCVAVDFDLNTQSCWAHYLSSDLISTFPTSGVNQYQLLTRCPTTASMSTSSTTSTTTTTTTTTTLPSTFTFTMSTTTSTTSTTTSTTTKPATSTTTTVPRCPFFDTFPDTNSPGATGYDDFPSESLCRDFCATNTTCLAVDYNSLDRSCWVHYNGADLQTRTTFVGVKQFVLRQRCPPSFVPPDTTTTTQTPPDFSTLPGQCPTWESREANSLGGTSVPSATNLAACQANCLWTPSCVAIDYNAYANECWVHLDARNLETVYATNGVTQYRIRRCDQGQAGTSEFKSTSTPVVDSPASTSSGVCTPQYDRRDDVSGYGANLVGGVNTEQGCLDHCLANANCIALDYNTNYQTCWTYTDPRTTYIAYSNPGVRHYNITVRCTQPACEPKWIIRYGTHAMGGQRLPESLSPSDCVAYCLKTSTCIGVDVDTSISLPYCWVHSNIQDFAQLYSNPLVNQYQLSARCSSETPDACAPSWIIRNGTQSQGGYKSTTPLLLFDCLNLCSNSPRCVAIDSNVDLNPPECWIYEDSTKLINKYSNPSVNQYELTSRCPTNTLPKDTGGCGGKSASPGQIYPPCMVPISPPATCNTYTLQMNGHGLAQWVNSQGPCMKPTCSVGAQLCNYLGQMRCVVAGWGGWGQCNARCGYGKKKRFNYWANLFSYFSREQDEQSCYSPC